MDIFYLAVFAFLTVIFALCAYIASAVFRYYSKSAEKNTTYECGMASKEDASVQFEPKFISYAIMFLLFEAEAVLLFPYALYVKELGLFGLFEIAIFILILLFALIFAIKSGILRYL